MEPNYQSAFHETSFHSDISETEPSSPPIKTDRQRTIEDIRKKFKVQNLGSFKALRPGNLNTEQSNDKEKQSQVLMKMNERFQDLYDALEIIGQGSSSVVKTVRKNGTDEIFVAKIIRARDQEHLDTLKNEYRILTKLEHKNIVKAYDLLVDNNTGTAQIILEYCRGKTLQEILSEKIRMDESTVKHIVDQLISAVDYLHDKGVCHRDISPQNIILNDKNEVKLVDFSVARIFRKELWSPLAMNSALRKRSSPLLPSYPGMMLTDAGTPAFKAPEVITGIPYNESVDMWSIGVVTFYALAGYRPFYSKNLDRLYKKISSAKCRWDPVIWKDISYEATVFVTSCLTKFPFIRLRTKEALRHPWIKGVKLQSAKAHPKPPKRSSSTNVEHIEKIEKRNESPKPRYSLYTTLDL